MVEINCNNMVMLGSKNDQPEHREEKHTPPLPPNMPFNDVPPPTDDDLPF